MAIDFPASPTLNQTFSVGNTNYVWDGTKWTASVTGGIALDKIQEGNTSAEVVDTGSDGRFVVTTEGSERLRVTAAGLVGVGTAAFPASTPIQVKAVGAGSGGYAIVSANDENAGGIILNASSENSVRIEADPGNLRASSYINLSVDGNERARIDSSGRLLVGTSSARSNFRNGSQSAQIQLEGTSADTSRLAIINNSNTDTGFLYFARSKGTTTGSNTVVTSGDYLGSIIFAGNDGSEFVDGATIDAIVDGTPGANDLPTRLVFSTTADGASSPTERMRITSNALIQATANIEVTTQSVGGGFAYSSTSASTRWDFGNFNNQTPFYVRNGANGVQLNAGSTSWSTSSDERFKADLVAIDNGLSKVATLRAVTGRYTTDSETVRRSFLIAQDVQSVLPEAVEEGEDEEKTLSLRYTEVIPLLVAALKESKERIEQLETEMAEVKAQLL